MCSNQEKKCLYGLCKTSWVERHTCFDNFAEKYSIYALQLRQLHSQTIILIFCKRNLMIQRVTSGTGSEETEILSLWHKVFFMKGMTVKLQKRGIDVIDAYNQECIRKSM